MPDGGGFHCAVLDVYPVTEKSASAGNELLLDYAAPSCPDVEDKVRPRPFRANR